MAGSYGRSYGRMSSLIGTSEPAMMQQPRRRHQGALLTTFATISIILWLGLVFAARSLAADPATAGYGATLGFFVIAMCVVVFALFMMAVDSDKS